MAIKLKYILINLSLLQEEAEVYKSLARDTGIPTVS